MTALSKADRDGLKDLNAKSRRIAVLIKWRRPFFTKLEDLRKPQNTILLGVFGKPLAGVIGDLYLRHFDLVIWYETSYERYKVGAADFDSVKIDELQTIVAEIVDVCGARKVRLLIGEEVVIQTVAALRQKHRIPGAIPSDLVRIRDKEHAKALALASGVPSAPYVTVSSENLKSEDDIWRAAREIERKTSEYPIFVKPTRGEGSQDAARLTDPTALQQWLSQLSRRPAAVTFLVEPVVSGSEFWAHVHLAEDGRRFFTYVGYMPYVSLAEGLNTGRPLCYVMADANDADHVLPGVSRFVHSVCHAYQPPYPYVFVVQGFHSRQTGEFTLTELSHRITGERHSSISYRATGISVETAFIELHLNPEYVPRVDAKYEKVYTAELWYPTVTGVLRSKNLVPMDKLSSSVLVKWFYDTGMIMKQATSLAGMLVAISLINRDRKAVEKDLEYLYHNFSIDVASLQ